MNQLFCRRFTLTQKQTFTHCQHIGLDWLGISPIRSQRDGARADDSLMSFLATSYIELFGNDIGNAYMCAILQLRVLQCKISGHAVVDHRAPSAQISQAYEILIRDCQLFCPPTQHHSVYHNFILVNIWVTVVICATFHRQFTSIVSTMPDATYCVRVCACYGHDSIKCFWVGWICCAPSTWRVGARASISIHFK